MNAARRILAMVLEAEEEDSLLKDVTEPPDVVTAGRTTVKAFKIGRMKVVDTTSYTFLISFLTPVAYFDKRLGTYYRTSKQWSPTTNGHIQEWMSMIAKSPEWKDNQENWEPSDYGPPGGHYVRWPHFQSKRQKQISALFRSLIPSMAMKPHVKARMYRVDPRMRVGSRPKRYISGHLKHHDSGEEGLPRPGDEGFEEFFKDFDPDRPETYDWTDGMRNRDPHEPDEPEQ